MEPSRWWGDDRAIHDDEEARRLILDAAGRCIVRRGNTQFRMGEVADEAGVSRSTVYRYFPARDDVLLGLMLMRVDKALGDLVEALPAPDDPVRSVPEMVLARVESVDGNPLNEALFAAESTAVGTALEKGSEPIVRLLLRHYEPLLNRWKAAGRLYDDLDPSSIVQWLHTTTLFLLAPSWRRRPTSDKRKFVEQFVVRALVPQIRQ
ncbi:TetR family transcriptional regulator [Mycobacterium paraense]|uniref:TetR family transcriptional regulator n=1 Tax=Mycobacterium paraense TaxID=767916 RepID=A0A1X2AB79_9MYCO|nr:TetR/AcrR family transcriptional regulator [Mycobacterium paraense]MCV7445639.1 TetR/AcrR family transcriptional regulator [Mycobacterium paraense]ORW30125.1 TetR family transcriptional regulator [Mycobacterium paraense]ORW37015.1 TetR family transcriptional regulator [Mycobacterium paraense]ORW39826.1 TetR family transcriptional regulator [Mycobacterium paraense]ORW47114.1 TetR family transcriptional regulator [Mycobacterium paraense]